MVKAYKGTPSGLSDPAEDCVVITPSDDDDLVSPILGIYSSGNGNIKITTLQGSEVTHPVLAGQRLDIRITKVHATGTTGGLTLIGYL